MPSERAREHSQKREPSPRPADCKDPDRKILRAAQEGRPVDRERHGKVNQHQLAFRLRSRNITAKPTSAPKGERGQKGGKWFHGQEGS